MDVFYEISNLISNYFANKKIKLDAILNFYKKFEEFNFKDEDLSFVLNVKGMTIAFLDFCIFSIVLEFISFSVSKKIDFFSINLIEYPNY